MVNGELDPGPFRRDFGRDSLKGSQRQRFEGLVHEISRRFVRRCGFSRVPRKTATAPSVPRPSPRLSVTAATIGSRARGAGPMASKGVISFSIERAHLDT